MMITKQAEASIPTELGNWQVSAYARSADSYVPHLALEHLPASGQRNDIVMVRIHSECMTGDLFGSNRCDCGEQLSKSMEMMAENGGVILYLRQEGRGIGIINKLKAYNLQDEGADTIDANTMLGHQADERSYEIAIAILHDMGIKEIDLITNNPEKIHAFQDGRITLHRRIPIVIEPRKENEKYLKTKEALMGHILGNTD